MQLGVDGERKLHSFGLHVGNITSLSYHRQRSNAALL